VLFYAECRGSAGIASDNSLLYIVYLNLDLPKDLPKIYPLLQLLQQIVFFYYCKRLLLLPQSVLDLTKFAPPVACTIKVLRS
jgi:hypothetical protein